MKKNNLLNLSILIIAGVLGLVSYPSITTQLELTYTLRDHFIVALLVVIAAGGFLYGRACRQIRKP